MNTANHLNAPTKVVLIPCKRCDFHATSEATMNDHLKSSHLENTVARKDSDQSQFNPLTFIASKRP